MKKRLFLYVVMTVLAVSSSIWGLSLSLNDVHARCDDGLLLESAPRLGAISTISSIGSISPGYSAAEDRFFVTTKLPFPSKIHTIHRFNSESRNFQRLTKTKDLFYMKLEATRLYFQLMAYDELLRKANNDSLSRTQRSRLFERKQTEAALKKLLLIPHHERLQVQGALADMKLHSFKRNNQDIDDTSRTYVDHEHAQKDLELEELRLKTLSRSYLPNLILTVEYWQDRDLTSTVIGLEFPLLSFGHRGVVKAVKQSVKTKELALVKVDNDVRIELDMLIEEANYLVDQINAYEAMPAASKAKYQWTILQLRARYATVWSILDLIFRQES